MTKTANQSAIHTTHNDACRVERTKAGKKVFLDLVWPQALLDEPLFGVGMRSSSQAQHTPPETARLGGKTCLREHIRRELYTTGSLRPAQQPSGERRPLSLRSVPHADISGG